MGNNRDYNQMGEHNHWLGGGSRGTCPGCQREKEQKGREDRKWWMLGGVGLLVMVVVEWCGRCGR